MKFKLINKTKACYIIRINFKVTVFNKVFELCDHFRIIQNFFTFNFVVYDGSGKISCILLCFSFTQMLLVVQQRRFILLNYHIPCQLRKLFHILQILYLIFVDINIFQLFQCFHRLDNDQVVASEVQRLQFDESAYLIDLIQLVETQVECFQLGQLVQVLQIGQAVFAERQMRQKLGVIDAFGTFKAALVDSETGQQCRSSFQRKVGTVHYLQRSELPVVHKAEACDVSV
ncbi:Hypothetical_protein [Hexamita inflata]|uniref:Hypothetical_protein n=1 Tax=Hexamita inflata TaxID=28002 RepID=A0AA86RI73_9EUKA|nr:Hypothetical protein HINF_LOCUS15343 [Hexamita inflata]CAI9972574.1 Hypothetical protein HINF_LOCUS60219 [Hexamita inflata]